MFWRMTALSASSPVESVLDKENFTLEELLDEEEVIQECKALNSRLINFLRDRAQVEQLLHYIVEEVPEDAESKRAFKFPFIACEIFTCEIDVILKTLVEEEELMNLLFSFLEPNRPHSTLLAGYFSKVVVCLMVRKTVPLMSYVQAHQDVFRRLVDLIGITSIMEVLVRLVGADDHVYPNFMDVMQWLADSCLLEMIVDKLSPYSPPEVHANAAETLCAITWNASSALATKLLSPSFVARIFGHALEDSQSKSGLIHSLSVCISLLSPKRSASPLISSFRNQHLYEPPVPVSHETVGAMLPKLGDLLMLLDVSLDEKILQTTYGELRPPLGKHRLKIVEFIAVLLRTGNEVAEKELVNSGAIRRVLDLFFEYPFNNSLHHYVESIISSCLESKNITVIDHLFRDCNLIEKFLQADRLPILSGDSNKPTLAAAGKRVPRAGNLGHLTRISNKLIQLGQVNSHVHAYLQENCEWIEWQGTILQERNNVENVYRWACGRPTTLQEKARDSDDELNDRDYDVTALANNLSQAFRYSMFEHEDTEEVNGSLERDDEDVYFDDDSAEVVISSLRLGDDQGSLFTNSNWFAFQEDRVGNEPLSTSLSGTMDEINLNGPANGGSSSSDDEVVVGEDEEFVNGMASGNGASSSSSNFLNGCTGSDPANKGDANPRDEKASASGDLDFFQYATADNNPFHDRSLPDWVGWQESADLQIDGSSRNPFSDSYVSEVDLSSPTGPAGNSLSNGEVKLSNGMSIIDASARQTGNDATRRRTVPSLFEEDVEFVGVELEGTERAMEQALKEGIVGEAGPLKRNLSPKAPEKEKHNEDGPGIFEFNDANYWRVDQEIAVVQE
ncbi:serine/threonine-protein phosphatase 6 regulatory subunit 2-like isoform X2 [Telopea speciosissima]|uniref:serine/threonine-protein phosphatase 6 regulatory subunit 2-like isoform X2 n=1 Tax=Telopea speciosissima TaxID=54955 RepID=UPI001CC54734|nr:serine/threonine-protein phosphatase 6 regulatory subunit 2-like isoform X2 [Telopea speciosissima]